MAGLIVHEWIARHGGSENVAEAMARAFPHAEIRCLWNDAPERFAGRRVTESWMARTPLRRNKIAALPFMPWTWAHTDVTDSEFVLVSSHLFAHHVGGSSSARGPRKFAYIHTPARYIWAPDWDARGRSVLARAASPALKALDKYRASQGACFAANSSFVRDRIRAAWDQDATVIHPPVDVAHLQSVPAWRDALMANDQATLSRLPDRFVLGASRFISYKRLEVAIQAGEAVDLPVVLAGSGPQRNELVARAAAASVPVTIVDKPSNELLYALYQTAVTFVFPAVEDFGIMPVEAMCLGTPVVVSPIGGTAESVSALRGGIVLESFSKQSLKQAVLAAAALDMEYARVSASDQFGESVFSQRLRSWMAEGGVPQELAAQDSNE